MSTANGERRLRLAATRHALYSIPLYQLFELPGRPHVVWQLRSYADTVNAAEAAQNARNDVPFLFKAFETGQIGPKRMAKMHGGKPRVSTIHEYLDWTVTAQAAQEDDELDFGGFRVLVLLPRYVPKWPYPNNPSTSVGQQVDKRLGPPLPPLPFLQSHGRPLSAATIRSGPGYLEIPFVATSEGKRGQGFCRCLLEAIEDVSRCLGLPKLMLCSTNDPIVKSTWYHLGFEFTTEEQMEEWDTPHSDLVYLQNTTQMHKAVPEPGKYRSVRIKHGNFTQRVYARLDKQPKRPKLHVAPPKKAPPKKVINMNTVGNSLNSQPTSSTFNLHPIYLPTPPAASLPAGSTAPEAGPAAAGLAAGAAGVPAAAAVKTGGGEDSRTSPLVKPLLSEPVVRANSVTVLSLGDEPPPTSHTMLSIPPATNTNSPMLIATYTGDRAHTPTPILDLGDPSPGLLQGPAMSGPPVLALGNSPVLSIGDGATKLTSWPSGGNGLITGLQVGHRTSPHTPQRPQHTLSLLNPELDLGHSPGKLPQPKSLLSQPSLRQQHAGGSVFWPDRPGLDLAATEPLGLNLDSTSQPPLGGLRPGADNLALSFNSPGGLNRSGSGLLGFGLGVPSVSSGLGQSLLNGSPGSRVLPSSAPAGHMRPGLALDGSLMQDGDKRMVHSTGGLGLGGPVMPATLMPGSLTPPLNPLQPHHSAGLAPTGHLASNSAQNGEAVLLGKHGTLLTCTRSTQGTQVSEGV